jgi:hypothetical protein
MQRPTHWIADVSELGVNHAPGNIFIYARKQTVLAAIDIINRGWSVYNACGASEHIRGWVDADDWSLDYDFIALVSGHVTRWGTREEAVESRQYTATWCSSREALADLDGLDLLGRLGLTNAWVLSETHERHDQTTRQSALLRHHRGASPAVGRHVGDGAAIAPISWPGPAAVDDWVPPADG